MKKLITCFVLFCTFFSVNALPVTRNLVLLDLKTCVVKVPQSDRGTHRTPPVAPIIYIDMETSTLYSEAPLYDCTVNLVSEFGEVLFSTVVPDEATEVQLPTMAPGVYELQIVRGDYIFYCEIEF